MTTAQNAEQLFIGLIPKEEWKRSREGYVDIPRHHVPLRVYLADGSIHAYVTSWTYRDDVMKEGTRTARVDGSGEHSYVVAPSGALHIVEKDRTVHASLELGGQDEMFTNERVFITYAPGSWQRVTGPWMKDLPEKESHNVHTYPGKEDRS